MCVGGGREADSFLDREANDFVRRIKFIHGFPPPGRRKLDRQAARCDQVERFTDEIVNRRLWSIAVDLDQVEMRQAIDKPARGDLANPAKIIAVDFVDVATAKLFCAG